MYLLNFEIAGARALLRTVALGLLLAGACNGAFADEAKRFLSFGDSFTDISNAGPGSSNYPSRYKPESEFKDRNYYPVSYQLYNSLGLSPLGTEFYSYGQGGATVLKAKDRGWLNEQVKAAIDTLATGQLNANDVVMINMGINDAYVPLNAAQAAENGMAAAVSAVEQMDLLVTKGAKNVVFIAFSSVNFALDDWRDENARALGNSFSHAYYEKLKVALPPLTKSGVRFFLIDLDKFYGNVKKNLKGDSAVKFDCYGPVAIDNSCPKTNPVAVLQDKLHPSTSGFKVLARSVAKFYLAPDKVPDFGALIIDSGSLKGDVLNNGQIIAHRGKDSKFDASISGSGELTFVGPSSLTVSATVTSMAPSADAPISGEVLHFQ